MRNYLTYNICKSIFVLYKIVDTIVTKLLVIVLFIVLANLIFIIIISKVLKNQYIYIYLNYK
jgi:hypothetical protein